MVVVVVVAVAVGVVAVGVVVVKSQTHRLLSVHVRYILVSGAHNSSRGNQHC